MTTMHGGVKRGYSVLIEMQKGLKAAASSTSLVSRFYTLPWKHYSSSTTDRRLRDKPPVPPLAAVS